MLLEYFLYKSTQNIGPKTTSIQEVVSSCYMRYKMKILNWKKLSNTNFILCLLATCCLSIYAISRFIHNEDVTLVKFTKFQSSADAIYPSISFCLLPPFLEERFYIYGDENINMTSYQRFLKGEIWNENMLDVDYDNVTVSFSDNLLGAYLVSHNYSTEIYRPDHYVSFRSGRRKCFTINAPILRQEALFYFQFYVKNDLFPNGGRSASNRIFTYFHYPGQRFTAYYTIKYNWNDRKNTSNNYIMHFSVRNIDVVSRRNIRQEPCLEEWKKFDQYVMDQTIKQAKCRPPHWPSTLNTSLCLNTTLMKIFARQPSTAYVEAQTPPCKIIDRLDYRFEEVDANTDTYRQ